MGFSIASRVGGGSAGNSGAGWDPSWDPSWDPKPQNSDSHRKINVSAQKPNNLTIMVLDNAHFGETGMQPSHTGHGVDLTKVANGCGFINSQTINDYDTLDAFSNTPNAGNGPRFAVVKITTDDPERALPNLDGVHIKNRVRGSLGIQPI